MIVERIIWHDNAELPKAINRLAYGRVITRYTAIERSAENLLNRRKVPLFQAIVFVATKELDMDKDFDLAGEKN